MNNYHTLKALLPLFSEALLNAKVHHAFSMYKNQLEIVFDVDSSQVQLVISTLPNKACVFLDKELRVRKKNITSLISPLYEKRLLSINVIENDRIVIFSFEQNYQLILQLFGNQPNVLLISSRDLIVIDAFKKAEAVRGTTFAYPNKKTLHEIDENDDLKQAILKTIPTMDRKMLSQLAEVQVDQSDFSTYVSTLKRKLDEASTTYVYDDGIVTSLPPEFLKKSSLVREFKNANEAVQFAYRFFISKARFIDQKGQYQHSLKLNLASKQKKLQQLLDFALEENRASRFESYAHSLMSFGPTSNIEKRAQKIQLPDVYNAETILEIPIDPELSLIQNAEKYYSRAKYVKQQFDTNRKEAKQTQHIVNQLEEAKKYLENVSNLSELKDWKKTYKQWATLQHQSAANKERIYPFKVLDVGSLSIWLGKNAKSNDALMRESHKEDVWFHAKDVAGSHALIRMANKKEMPDKRIIDKVAALAAYHSKLRGSSLVPVTFTKRKFVRKPKNAPPGLVVVDKEEVVLVEPSNSIDL